MTIDSSKQFYIYVKENEIQTKLAFLFTQVKSPVSDDYKKRARVTKSVSGTIDIPLTLKPMVYRLFSDELMHLLLHTQM
jgi:hypothetical protein